jgi:hypothetical protein
MVMKHVVPPVLNGFLPRYNLDIAPEWVLYRLTSTSFSAWLLYRPQESRLELQQQLQTVSRNAYRKERIRFQQRKESFRSRYRWQRNSDNVLTNLETQWQQAQRANFTQ